jgi:hypothetical protein
MSEFLFLYRSAAPQGSPEQLQKTMQKWSAWMKELSEKGHLKSEGNPLERTGRLVKGQQKTVTDGPFAEAKDAIGGYSLVEARDLAHAVELAKGCPTFETDGAVEVRPIRKMTM